jgi:hypothetical protein
MFFNYLLNKINIFKTKINVLKYNNHKHSIKKYDNKFITNLRYHNNSRLFNTYDKFNYLFASDKQFTQSEMIIEIIKHGEVYRP